MREEKMSLNKKHSLSHIATKLARELRQKSTDEEKIIWEMVRNRKFHELKINRQFPIFYDIEGKESFYIADFYCHEKQTIIEIDGDYHNWNTKNDKIRDEVCNSIGLKVLRIKNYDVTNNIEMVKQELKKFLFYG